MNLLAASLVAATLTQSAPITPRIHELTFATPSGGSMLYAISIPRNYYAQTPVPLVLVLHSGGNGCAITAVPSCVCSSRGVERPATIHGRARLPDECLERRAPRKRPSWRCLQNVLGQFNIDRRRILVTGFSLGGRGTWFMASRHADLFTASIPMASSPGDLPIDRLATMPTYSFTVAMMKSVHLRPMNAWRNS